MAVFMRVEDLCIWDCRRRGFFSLDSHGCICTCSNRASDFVYQESYPEIRESHT